jgi:hypothetical protein
MEQQDLLPVDTLLVEVEEEIDQHHQLYPEERVDLEEEELDLEAAPLLEVLLPELQILVEVEVVDPRVLVQLVVVQVS